MFSMFQQCYTTVLSRGIDHVQGIFMRAVIMEIEWLQQCSAPEQDESDGTTLEYLVAFLNVFSRFDFRLQRLQYQSCNII